MITEVTLRLFGRPEAVAAAVCPFESMEGATRTVITTIQLGIPVARIEIIDEQQLDLVNRYSKTNYPLAPTLFFEFHGISQEAVDEHARAVQDDRLRERRTGFPLGVDAGGARDPVAGAPQRALRDDRVAAGRQAVDVRRLRADLPPVGVHPRDAGRPAAVQIVAPLVGHAGDGNFHLIFMVDTGDAAEMERVKAANARLVERALRLGGTCTGEHGVGFGKLKYLAEEHGDSLDTMRAIKRALDPHNLMNPGKLIPE